MRKLSDHVRSNVIGYICLVWLMTGTAVAATQLPSGSVGSPQLRAGAVDNRALASRAITGAKVKPGSLTGAQIRPDSLSGAQIRESSLGEVPQAGSATSAGHADTATSAGHADTAAHADTAGSAASATNADQLGGAGAASYQHRVSGTCATTTAVSQVNADGTVACRAVGTVDSVTAGSGLTGGGGSAGVSLAVDPTVFQKRLQNGCAGTAMTSINADGIASCAPQQIDGFSNVIPISHGINLLRNTGGLDIGIDCATPKFVRFDFFNESGGPGTLNWVFNDGTTTHASGQTLAAGANALLSSTTGRMEGQVILGGPNNVTTLNFHAFTNGTICEFIGTTVEAFL
jgi:hypothetical protein